MLIINYLHCYVGLILNAHDFITRDTQCKFPLVPRKQLPLLREFVALLYSNDVTSYSQQPISIEQAEPYNISLVVVDPGFPRGQIQPLRRLRQSIILQTFY